MSHTFVQPPEWQPPRGYSNGIIARGRTLYVAGQVGWDPTSAAPKFPATFAEQWDLALSNVLAVVKAAGGGPEHLVRLTIYVTDKQAYLASLKPLGSSWKQRVGKHYPVMALVMVAGLVEPGAQVEIEATAVLPD